MPRTLLVLAAAVALFGACGKANAEVRAADHRKVAPLEVSNVPGEVLGLKVGTEDISKTLKDARRPYFDATGLYSLRDGDLLQATLQVGRFATGTRYRDPAFRSSLLATLGGGAAKELRMGDQQVYLTSGDRQAIAVWFRGRDVFILSSREEYKYPRTLLRRMLEVQP